MDYEEKFARSDKKLRNLHGKGMCKMLKNCSGQVIF